MADDPRPKLIEDAFTAFQARDAEGVFGFLDPAVRCRVNPPLMNAGEWQGYEGFVQMTAGWEEAFGQITYDIREIELADDRTALVAVHQAATGAGSGVPVALDVFFLVEFEGERAVRLEIHADRESAAAAT